VGDDRTRSASGEAETGVVADQRAGASEPVRATERRPVLRRAARRTNVALLWLLVGAFCSGWFVFAAAGRTTATTATVVHGLFGVAVIAMLPWKSVIVRRASRLRVASVLLLVIVAGCLVAGFVQLFVGYVVVAGITPIQVHVGAAAVIGPLLIWHLLRHRRQRLRRSDLSRRALVQDVVIAAAVAACWGGTTAVAARIRPDRPRAPTGSRPAVPGPAPAASLPATTWLFDTIPDVDPSTHLVDVAGGSFTVAELIARAEPVTARLDCTNGWYADARWDAVRLVNLIAPAALDGATTLRVRSVTGYERAFPVAQAAQLWLAVGSRGAPLTPAHGAPVRLLAPGHRGFWWVKWVAAVELDDRPSWLQPTFPLQ
jgi:hypothetical protein